MIRPEYRPASRDPNGSYGALLMAFGPETAKGWERCTNDLLGWTWRKRLRDTLGYLLWVMKSTWKGGR